MKSVNVTLHGKRAFADVTKVRILSRGDDLGGLETNLECPQREGWGYLREEEEGNAATVEAGGGQMK